MSIQGFSLIPFPSVYPLPNIMITGRIELRSSALSVTFELSGAREELAIPEKDDISERRDRLWEGTCFELFLAPKDSEQYWEFNLSPAGHWNAYRFLSCRLGMQEEEAISSVLLRVQRDGESLLLSTEVDIWSVLKRPMPLDVGISTVIKATDGTMSYWALSHPGPKPDFHRRNGFILELE